MTVRKNGKCAGTKDKMWMSPEGKKFRSKVAVEKWLALSEEEREQSTLDKTYPILKKTKGKDLSSE